MFQEGLLKTRQKNKALKLLKMDNPHFTTTQALRLINANCGAVKFHRILKRRKLATPVKESGEKGYNFDLRHEYGGQTYSMRHSSFSWTIAGVKYMSKILLSENIRIDMPQELIERLKG